MRLDHALVARSLARSRTEARALILAGSVGVGGQTVFKPARPVGPEETITVDGTRCRYVGRGGLKLEAALSGFALDVRGWTALDVGASTGGWTDCLLQHGARRVVAIDVGHGQIDPALRDDPRVLLREGVNARHLEPGDFEERFDLVCADVSFISLTLVIPALAPLVQVLPGHLICLVKPQFEAGPDQLDRGGIVRDPAARHAAERRVAEAAAGCGLVLCGRMDCPMPGLHGNRESLLWLRGAEGSLLGGVE